MNDDRPFSRRDLLRLGLTAGAASLAGACGWQGGPLLPLLRGASHVNDVVGEKVLLSGHRLAPQYPVSERTPEQNFPAYSLTRPAPRLADPSTWALEVGGRV